MTTQEQSNMWFQDKATFSKSFGKRAEEKQISDFLSAVRVMSKKKYDYGSHRLELITTQVG